MVVIRHLDLNLTAKHSNDSEVLHFSKLNLEKFYARNLVKSEIGDTHDTSENSCQRFPAKSLYSTDK